MYAVIYQVFYQANDPDDAQHLANIMKDRLDNLTPPSTVVRQVDEVTGLCNTFELPPDN